ncbi:gamma-glutamyl hydrolase A-like [Lytechinus variegatus]|uniref:gamma-glutamyl hydrolase A-like n=1 Tax=Lytechinus variegatus TaxID=7654 RepID=UPI001BB14161|nr:gamma-glutamyl hydrolase A-like [Lytechinus variegatus]
MNTFIFNVTFLIISVSIISTYALPLRPVVGVLAQGSSSSIKKYGASYIAASYIKYLESAGARVVPVLVNQTDEYYNNIFKSLNGILFPGGGSDIVDVSHIGYSGAAHILYHKALEANKQGDFFPLWGICLGFEELMVQTAGEDVLIEGIKASNISFPVQLEQGYEQSRLLNANTTPPSIIKTLSTVNSTLNSHNMALTPTNFTRFTALSSFFQVLSTNVDLNGVRFISTVEAYDYPFYGTQWHPEKNAFEWKVNSCHAKECVELMQYMANFFVEEARKSQHQFSSPDEMAKHLIYNYDPVNLSQSSSAFEQAYFFP